ncbi:hypothetical protein cyc_05127 [Cyclospora cayetanensis]|uniref:Uncharacterized protein n=1 Tax=Cyclospora cayetanensis TaxID=88456 RepID=A0A1D3D7Z6_9EIME|nr:hypothetical protein cyc_05127 [Cyclospora cayetanensis]
MQSITDWIRQKTVKGSAGVQSEVLGDVESGSQLSRTPVFLQDNRHLPQAGQAPVLWSDVAYRWHEYHPAVTVGLEAALRDSGGDVGTPASYPLLPEYATHRLLKKKVLKYQQQ